MCRIAEPGNMLLGITCAVWSRFHCSCRLTKVHMGISPMAAITNSGEDAIQREVAKVRPPLWQPQDEASFCAFFEIERTEKAINKHNYTKVALQFPDELLPFAARVVAALTCRCHAHFVVLGDTSYGSCCVDEVAAEHVGADLVVHYGHSCLSRTSRIPALYVFGESPIDVAGAAKTIYDVIKEEQHVLMVAGVECARISADVCEHLVRQGLQIACTAIDSVYFGEDPLLGATDSSQLLNFSRDKLPDAENLSESFSFLYLGDRRSQALINLCMTYSQHKFYSFDPQDRQCRLENLNINKRYFLVEKAKSAQTVGILLGTLGVSKYMDVLQAVKSLCDIAEKQYYTFLMGKVNPAKLANFTEVDIYVLIACPENSMLDSSEFFKPVVTPFELELACASNRSWTGRYTFEFDQIIENANEDLAAFNINGRSREPEFSLATSSYVTRASDSAGSSSTAIVARQEGTIIAAGGGAIKARFYDSLLLISAGVERKKFSRPRTESRRNPSNEGHTREERHRNWL